MKNKSYLKISELADLADINKRTLHYYDEIGLFTPKIKDDNGYRYYSITQVLDLSLILSLRELNMSLKDIQVVVSKDFNEAEVLLVDKVKDIDKKIEDLEDIRNVIRRKISFINIAKDNFLQVNLLHLDEEYLTLSYSIENKPFSDILEEAYDLLKQEGKYLFSNDEQGIMMDSRKSIQQIENQNYDYYYLKTVDKNENSFIKPAGKYLSIVYKGTEEERVQAYKKLLHYCEKKNIELKEYFYERELHETTYDSQNKDIIEIQVKIKEENSSENSIN